MYLGVEISECIKDAGGFGGLFVLCAPLRIPLKSLPPKTPSSILHTNIIKTSKQLLSILIINANHSLSNQNDILQLIDFNWKDSIILQQNQGLMDCLNTVFVFGTTMTSTLLFLIGL